MKVFNKVEKDFATLREYNDYLEEVEDISKYSLLALSLWIVFPVECKFGTCESYFASRASH